MQEKSYDWVNALGLIVSVLFFCTTMYLLIRDGYARDEQIYVSEFMGNGLWMLLLGCIICGIIFLNVAKIKNGRLSTIISTITIAALITFGIIITFGWFISYNQVKNNDIGLQNTSSIMLKD